VAFGDHAAWFAFTSDRFDTSSELPEDANAGNRFYGRDVAEFVADGLGGRGFETSFIDEDWGWQTHAARPDGSVLEVSVYHDPDEVSPSEWALMVRSLHKERKLGLTRFREHPVDAEAISALEGVFREAGIDIRRTAPQ
jgi:hypothetical protein